MGADECFGRVVAHILLAVVHGGQLHDDGKISAGHDGDSDFRQLHPEDILGLVDDAEAVIGLFVVPRLEMDNQVNRRFRLDSAYAVNMAHVDYTDAAQLHIVADHFRRGADQRIPPYDFDFNCVVGNQAVAAFDKLQRSFTLTHAALTRDEHALTVDLYQNAVPGNPRCKITVELINQAGRKLGGVLLGVENIAVVLFSGFQALLKRSTLMADDKSGNLFFHEFFKGFLALLEGKHFQIRRLYTADDLDAGRIKVIVEPCELHGRAVDICRGNDSRIII